MSGTTIEKPWRDETGAAIPLEDCTKEQLIERFHYVVARHHDRLTAEHGAKEALIKRIASHRKAKAEANKRADAAVLAMKAMMEAFEVKS